MEILKDVYRMKYLGLYNSNSNNNNKKQVNSNENNNDNKENIDDKGNNNKSYERKMKTKKEKFWNAVKENNKAGAHMVISDDNDEENYNAKNQGFIRGRMLKTVRLQPNKKPYKYRMTRSRISTNKRRPYDPGKAGANRDPRKVEAQVIR